jgi:hypothetical protein
MVFLHWKQVRFGFGNLIGLLAPVGPKTVGRLFNLGLAGVVGAGIAVLFSIFFSMELKGLFATSWGVAIVCGGLIAMLLLAIELLKA